MTRLAKPDDMNGDHGIIFDMLAHVNARIDRIYVGVFLILAGVIGTLVAVLAG